MYSSFLLHYIRAWSVHYFKTCYLIRKVVDSPKMIMYSSEGRVRYYNSREARQRIHKGELFGWTETMISKRKDILYIDDGSHERSEDVGKSP